MADTDFLEEILTLINDGLVRADLLKEETNLLGVSHHASGMRRALEELALDFRDKYGDERFVERIEGGFREVPKVRRWASAEKYQNRVSRERGS